MIPVTSPTQRTCDTVPLCTRVILSVVQTPLLVLDLGETINGNATSQTHNLERQVKRHVPLVGIRVLTEHPEHKGWHLPKLPQTAREGAFHPRNGNCIKREGSSHRKP